MEDGKIYELKIQLSQIADNFAVSKKIKSMDQVERKTLHQVMCFIENKDREIAVDPQMFEAVIKKLKNQTYICYKSSLINKIVKWIRNMFFNRISSEIIMEKFIALQSQIKEEIQKRKMEVEKDLASKMMTELYNKKDIEQAKGVNVEEFFHIFTNPKDLFLLYKIIKKKKMIEGTHFIVKSSKNHQKGILRIQLRGEWKKFGINNIWSTDKLMRMINLLKSNTYGLDFQELKRAVETPISKHWDHFDKVLYGLTSEQESEDCESFAIE